DRPTLQLSSATYKATESGSEVTLAVIKSGKKAARPGWVTWTTSPGTAVSPGDFVTATGTAFVGHRRQERGFTITLVTDSTSEGDEAFTVALSNPEHAVLGSRTSATVTITETAIPETMVSWYRGSGTGTPAGTSFTVREGQSQVFTVGLSRAAPHPVTIPIGLRAKHAFLQPDDYSVPSSVTFAQGEQTKEFTFEALADAVRDGGRVTLFLCPADSCPTHFTSGTTPPELAISITDSDSLVLSPDSLTLTEGGAPGAYTVALSADPGTGRTVTVTATSGNAAVQVNGPGGTAGSTATLTFTGGSDGNWNTPQTVTVTALRDPDATDLQDVRITHGTTIDNNSGTYHGGTWGNVEVDVTDAGHGVIVTGGPVSVAAGRTKTYSIRLKSRPSGNVVIRPASNNPARATVSGDLTFTSSGDNWKTPQDVTVTGVAPGTTSITHSVQTSADTANYPDSLTIPSVPVTVTAFQSVVQFTSELLVVAENAGTVNLPITLSPAPATDIMVSYRISRAGGGSPTGNMRAVTSGSTTANIPYTVNNDNTDEPADTFTLTLRPGTGYTVGDRNQTILYVNDDDGAGIDLDGVTEIVAVEGQSTQYRFKLATDPGANSVLVRPRSDTDVSIKPGIFRFRGTGDSSANDNNRWNVWRTITVTVAEDDDTADEQGIITHTAKQPGGDYHEKTHVLAVAVRDADVDVNLTGSDRLLVITRPEMFLPEGGRVQHYGVKLRSDPGAGATVTVTATLAEDHRDAVRIAGATPPYTVTRTFTGGSDGNWDTVQFVGVHAIEDTDKDSEQNVLIRHTTSVVVGGNPSQSHPYNQKRANPTRLYLTDDDAGRAEGLTANVDRILSKRTAIQKDEKAQIRYALNNPLTPGESVALRLSITGAAYGTDHDYTVSLPVQPQGSDFTTTLDVSEASSGSTTTPVTIRIAPSGDSTPGPAFQSVILEVTAKRKEAGNINVALAQAYSPDGSVTPRDEVGGVRVRECPPTNRRCQSRTVRILPMKRLLVLDPTIGTTIRDAEIVDSPFQVTLTEGGNKTFDIRLNSRPVEGNNPLNVTVRFASTDPSVTVSPAAMSFTTADWRTRQTLTVTAAQDADTDDDSAVVTIQVRGFPGVADGPELFVRALDDDPAARVIYRGVTLRQTVLPADPSADPPRETEVIELPVVALREGGQAAELTVLLTTNPGGDVTVTPTSADTSVATVSGAVTLNSSNYAEGLPITVTPVDDNDADDEETTVTFAVSGYGSVTAAQTVTVAVRDNEPAVRISPTALKLTEGGGGIYEVELNSNPAGTVTIDYTVSADTKATALGRLVFNALTWDTPKQVRVSALEDNDQTDDTVTITHAIRSIGTTSTDYASLTGLPTVTLTIADNDKPGVVISPATRSLTLIEGDVNQMARTYGMRLNSDPGSGQTVTITATSGDAMAAHVNAPGGTAAATASLSFTGGSGGTWNTVQSITVTALNDDTDAADESLTITHAITAAGTNYPDNMAVPAVNIIIQDNDEAKVSLSTTESRPREGQTVDVKVTLSHTLAEDVTIPVRRRPDSGTASTADFTISDDGDVVIEAGETEGKITFTAVDDGTEEQRETLTLEFGTLPDDVSAGSPASVGIAIRRSGTNYVTSGIVLSTTSLDVPNNGGSASYTVRLKQRPGAGTVTIRATSSDTNKVTVSPQDLDFNSNDFDTPQTFTVTAASGAAVDDTPTITHAVQATQDSSIYDTTLSLDRLDVTITERAAAPEVTVTLAAGDANDVTEGASGASGRKDVTVTLAGHTLTGNETVTVPLRVQGATVTTDYTFTLEPSSQSGVTLLTSGGSYSMQNPAVKFAAGAAAMATLRFTPVNNTLRTQPAVLIDLPSAPTKTGYITMGDHTGDVFFVIVDDETGDIEVPRDWALRPTAVSPAAKFRLLFVSTATRNAQSSNIEEYNDWLQRLIVTKGHSSIKPYAGLVKVLGSTNSVNARTNTATTGAGTGISIYWLGGASAAKAADDYTDFYDGTWDGTRQSDARSETAMGIGSAALNVYTGTDNDGTTRDPFGGTQVSYAQTSHSTTFYRTRTNAATPARFFGMSPVFTVEGVEASLAVSGGGNVTEGSTLTVTVNLGAAAPKALMIPVRMRTGGN
ncbi:MAG: hypothetical protein OXG47_07090, partial [bacterium]|nr:hypothetical protein [bacterium]